MRRRIFISHAFRHVADYAGVLERLRAHNYDIYNHSIPFWNPVDAEGRELASVIAQKIRGCDVIIVLVTPGIQHSAWIKYELELARHYRKRVVGVWRHGEAQKVPLPEVLDEQVYRMVGWHGPALIRAIEGKYPADARVFDIAEVEDRERLVRNIVSGMSLGVLVLIGTRHAWIPWLDQQLARHGVRVQLEPIPNGPGVVGPSMFGAVLGAIASALTKDPESNFGPFVMAGAAIGASAGLVMSYRLTVDYGHRHQTIDVWFEPPG